MMPSFVFKCLKLFYRIKSVDKTKSSCYYSSTDAVAQFLLKVTSFFFIIGVETSVRCFSVVCIPSTELVTRNNGFKRTKITQDIKYDI